MLAQSRHQSTYTTPTPPSSIAAAPLGLLVFVLGPVEEQSASLFGNSAVDNVSKYPEHQDVNHLT